MNDTLYTAEILTVGTEILLGSILNSNSKFLSNELANIGISLYKHTSVGDNPKRLLDAIDAAYENSNLIITTGGLGPTEDDITKEIASKYFGLNLVLDENSKTRLEKYFAGRNMTTNNLKQAYFPENSIIIENDYGTAPSCIIEKDNKTFIMLPGPPRECTNIFKDKILPYLKAKSPYIFYSRTLNFVGIGESALEDLLKDLIKNQTNPTIAPYAKEGYVTIRVTAKTTSLEEGEKLVEPTVKKIYSIASKYIFGEDDTTLQESVVKLLSEKKLTISTAESCTGGMLAASLIDVNGASEVFKEGFVTYSNSSKIKTLGVNPETLNKFGAVSEETAIEMATKVCQISGSDVGVGITGIAGPDGGTPEKPIGLIFIAICVNNETFVEKLNLNSDRNRNRYLTSLKALDLIRIRCKNL